MKCIIKKVKQGSAALKERWNRLTPGKRTAAGITVIELVLILVRNFTPYLGCVLCG